MAKRRRASDREVNKRRRNETDVKIESEEESESEGSEDSDHGEVGLVAAREEIDVESESEDSNSGGESEDESEDTEHSDDDDDDSPEREVHSNRTGIEHLPSLYNCCVHEIFRLLKSAYWSQENNPFIYLPSPIIHELVVRLLHCSNEVKGSDFKLLMMSGKVTEFVWTDISPSNYRILVEILQDLKSASDKLSKIIISFREKGSHNLALTLSKIRRPLNNLFKNAKNLKHVETNVTFDFYAVRNCLELETLILNFSVTQSIQPFIKVKGEYRPHLSLKHLELFYHEDSQFIFLDMYYIIKYCPELTYVNCKFSSLFCILHCNWRHKDNWRYKFLKWPATKVDDYSISERTLRLISQTFPDLHELSIQVTNNETVSALSSFQKLTTLVLCSQFLDYSAGLESVLESIGYKITTLSLQYFTNVDVSSIGRHCPNLRNLILKSRMAKKESELLPNAYKCLYALNVDYLDEELDQVVAILCNATLLRTLILLPGHNFTDETLKKILEKNKLSCLRSFETGCGLSLDGLQILASSLKALAFFKMRESFSVEAKSVINKIKPEVEVLSFKSSRSLFYHWNVKFPEQ